MRSRPLLGSSPQAALAAILWTTSTTLRDSRWRWCGGGARARAGCRSRLAQALADRAARTGARRICLPEVKAFGKLISSSRGPGRAGREHPRDAGRKRSPGATQSCRVERLLPSRPRGPYSRELEAIAADFSRRPFCPAGEHRPLPLAADPGGREPALQPTDPGRGPRRALRRIRDGMERPAQP